MQQRGWTYEPELQDESLGEPLTVGEKRAFVIEYGYGLFTMPVSPHDPSIVAAGRNGQRFRDLSVEDQAAFREDLRRCNRGGDSARSGQLSLRGRAGFGIAVVRPCGFEGDGRDESGSLRDSASAGSQSGLFPVYGRAGL